MLLSLQQVVLLLIATANLLVGIGVFLKNPRRIVNQAFFLFVAGSTAWVMGISLLYITHNFMFDKLALGGGFVLLFGMTLAARVFPSESRLSPRFLLLFIPLAFTSLFLPFNLFIASITVDAAGFIEPVNGPLFPLFAGNVIGYLIATIYYFVLNYRRSTGRARMQMLYLMTGVFTFVISLALFDAVLPLLGIYRFNLIGPATSLVFVLMTSYAIVRHQLLDIRIVIQRGVIYSVLISMIIGAYLFLLLLFQRYIYVARHYREALSAGIIMLIGILTVPQIERYFQKITDRFFFKDRYQYAHAVELLSKVLNAHLEMTELIPKTLDALTKIFKPSKVTFIHHAPDSTIPMEAELLIAVRAQDRLIGNFLFGRKRSGDPYTNEDRMLLRTFATQASIAFAKAELHQQLHDYSHSLEEKVLERTKDITDLQNHQRQLFDDISHALQTPLTVLKSAIETAAVNWRTEEKSTAASIERSLDDLSRLIRDLLELARLDAVPVEEQQAHIGASSLLNDIGEYVEVIAKQNGITMTRDIESDMSMLGNQKQIEVMLTNLLSNAVRYTSSSKVRTVSLSARIISNDATPGDAISSSIALRHTTPSSIEIVVKDTGIGIPPESLPHIFNRFYRVNDRRGAVGCGLGLAIVQRIVERHNGSIHVESELGLGTSFIVRLPYKDELMK
jgi:signal transduction histidine kinase